MYIKIGTVDYLEDPNLREIIQISGEVIGTFDTETDQNGAKTKINIVLEENSMEITEGMIAENYDSKDFVVYDIAQNKIIKKTINQLKTERLSYYQGLILKKLSENINSALNTQETGNKIRVSKGKTEIKRITDDQIDVITEYQDTVVNFHNTWNIEDYNIEDIDQNIFNGGLAIPDIVLRLL